jgi:hypothetical protein
MDHEQQIIDDVQESAPDAPAPGLFARLFSRKPRKAAPPANDGSTQLLPSPSAFPPSPDPESHAVPDAPPSESRAVVADAPAPRTEELDASLERIKRHVMRSRRPQPQMAAQTVRLETPITTDVLADDPMRPTRIATSLVTQLPPGSRIVSLVVEIPTG